MTHAKGSPVVGTFIRIVVGHDGHAFLPHHPDVCPIAITSPQEHGQEDGLSYGAPEDTQDHPAVGAIEFQTGKTHHLNKTQMKR